MGEDAGSFAGVGFVGVGFVGVVMCCGGMWGGCCVRFLPDVYFDVDIFAELIESWVEDVGDWVGLLLGIGEVVEVYVLISAEKDEGETQS